MKQVYELFCEPGAVVEIRALGLQGKSKFWKGWAREQSVVAGYFDNAEAFEAAAQALDTAKAVGVWFTINPPTPSLLARSVNKLVANPKATTTDQDITCLRWLPLDLDPVRPSGISADDAEVSRASELGKKITAWMEGEMGFAAGIRAFSGNGYHILYRLPDLPNDAKHRLLVKGCVEAIEAKFHNDEVEIDLKVFNPARVVKLYGTTGRKGDSTQDRPHRVSYLYKDQPHRLADVPVTPRDNIRALAAMAPEKPAYYPSPSPSHVLPQSGQQTADKPSPAGQMTYNLGTLDLEAYLSHYGRKIKKVKQEGAMTRYVLEECVFDPNHRNGEASIAQSPDYPWLTYQCYHDSCRDKTWKRARAEISGNDSLKQFCSGYNPTWKSPKTVGTGMLTKIEPVYDHEKSGLIEGATVPPPHEIDYAEFFEKRGKRASFVPRYMANYLLAYLQHIVYTEGVFWRYDHGVWQPYSRDKLVQICTIALKDQVQAHWVTNTIQIFQGLVTKTEQEWPQDHRYINCKNGMLDLKERRLIDHHPELWSRTQINASFDLDNYAERWESFLEEIFPEDKKKKDGVLGKAEMLQQMYGYCLMPDCRFQKAMFLYGVGSNGKSTALEALISVIGRDNTSSLTITDLGQRFKSQFLENKLINIATETNTKDPIASEAFKAAVRGDALTAERKYGEPYLFNPKAKWLVAMNDTPVIPDKSYGFTRSVIVVEFKRRFQGKEIDPELPDKLYEERDGILTWAVFGLERILKFRGFDIPETVKQESAQFMKTLNPVLLYMDERCEIEADGEVGSTELYKDYKEWCSEGGNRALSRNKFIDQILINYPTVSKGKIGSEYQRMAGFKGLSLKV